MTFHEHILLHVKIKACSCALIFLIMVVQAGIVVQPQLTVRICAYADVAAAKFM